MMRMKKVLEVKNLSKSFGKIPAVSGVSFDIGENQIFALIGPNGAGKSTTLRMIATILTPTSGSIKICGRDSVKEADEVRKMISYLPEEAGAYKNLTGLEYLKFMAALFAENRATEKRYLATAEEISNLKDRLKSKVNTYSKGMTRKLLLARTVMIEPKLAILDEPTSGLDVVNAFEIRKTINQLSKRGMSVLLSSHNMLEIEFLSEEVGIINQGKIQEIGSVSELKSKYKAKNLEEVFINSVHNR